MAREAVMGADLAEAVVSVVALAVVASGAEWAAVQVAASVVDPVEVAFAAVLAEGRVDMAAGLGAAKAGFAVDTVVDRAGDFGQVMGTGVEVGVARALWGGDVPDGVAGTAGVAPVGMAMVGGYPAGVAAGAGAVGGLAPPRWALLLEWRLRTPPRD
ncbi:hypothetical protein AD935_00850, partial [Gluconobacter japonicus]